MTGRAPAVVVLAALTASACATPHVQLAPPPEKTAPVEDRLAWYAAHRPEAVVRTRSPLAPPGSVGAAAVVFQDGARVSHVVDLLPLVDEGSATAAAVDDAEAARGWAAGWQAGSVGAMTVALIVQSASTVLTIGGPAMIARGADARAVWIGGEVAQLSSLVVMGAGAGLMLASINRQAAAARAEDIAVATFDASLRRRLAIDDDDDDDGDENQSADASQSIDAMNSSTSAR